MYAAKNFYLDAILNVADSNYDARRNIVYNDGMGLVNEQARGDTGGLTWAGGASFGYDFLLGALTVSPTLGAYYIDATIDSFTETGASGINLIYEDQDFKSLTGNVGLRLTYAWSLSWGVLLPHLRTDFVREFEDDVEVFGVRFAADPFADASNPTPPILIVLHVVGFLVSLLLLAAGIALVRRSRAGRGLHLLWAVAAVVLGVVHLVVAQPIARQQF